MIRVKIFKILNQGCLVFVFFFKIYFKYGIYENNYV